MAETSREPFRRTSSSEPDWQAIAETLNIDPLTVRKTAARQRQVRRVHSDEVDARLESNGPAY